MIFRPGSCWECGHGKTKVGYVDYMDGHTLLEKAEVCCKCNKHVALWSYGGSDDPFYYLKTRRERFRYLYFGILEDANGKKMDG